MSESKVTVTEAATIYEGPDAVRFFRAKQIKMALKLAEKGIKINSRTSFSALLQAAGQITHKTYRRRAYAAAVADLEQWIAAMTAALPIDKEQ